MAAGLTLSSVRASSTRLWIRRFRRATCAFALSSQGLSCAPSESRPRSAERMARGVLSSCEASVTKRRWRSRFSTNGRMATREEKSRITNTISAPARDTRSVTRSMLSEACTCRKQSSTMTVLPPPSSAKTPKR